MTKHQLQISFFCFLSFWICLLWFTFSWMPTYVRWIRYSEVEIIIATFRFQINLTLRTLKHTPLVLYVSTQKRSGFTLVVSFEFQFNKKDQKLYLLWLPNQCIEYAIWVLSGFSNFTSAIWLLKILPSIIKNYRLSS